MPILLQQYRINLASPGFRTRASAVEVVPLNHHAIIYCHNTNSRFGVLIPAQSRSNLGYISLSSHHAKQFSLPHHASTFSRIHAPCGQTLLVESPPNPSPSSHPMEVFWPSGNCPDCLSIQLHFANEPNSYRSPQRQ